MGKFKDGHEKVGGREKGSKNKIPKDLRDIIIAVAEGMHPDGMEAAIEAWAKKGRNETVFWTKGVFPLLPKTIEATIEDNDIEGRRTRYEERMKNGGKANG